jgi:hypothetical protein
LQKRIEAAKTPEELSAILAGAGSSRRWTASSLAQVAEFFSCATSTIKGWSQDGMPSVSDGWYLPAIVRWRFDRLSNTDLTTAKKQQDLALGQVQLESKQLELDQGRGQLLDRSEVELWASVALIEARVMITSLPERLSTSAPPEMRSFIREETDRHCRDVLTSLRRRLEMENNDDDQSGKG